ncbi:MAG: DMT family transporter [Akkermansiaceae bacterium]|nr:DMT family transporter [Akkermansiaceae bacterium]
MSFSDLGRLTLLSAIWGASFLFLRVAAPEFGPFALILIRTAGGALILLPFLLRPANRPILATHAGSLLLQGIYNSALPFCLIGWAALSLEAGFTSLLNASTPIFTAIIGFCWLRIPLQRSQVIGLVIGFAGIAILAGDQLTFKKGGTGWAVLAVLVASCSYGMAGHYAKLRFAGIPPMAVSAGSLFYSSFLLLPLGFCFWPSTLPSAPAIASAIALALICTALAFVLFFDVLSRTGATAAATVTFVIPVFGVLWGVLFLQEEITIRMMLGMAVALCGTALVTKLLPPTRRRKA